MRWKSMSCYSNIIMLESGIGLVTRTVMSTYAISRMIDYRLMLNDRFVELRTSPIIFFSLALHAYVFRGHSRQRSRLNIAMKFGELSTLVGSIQPIYSDNKKTLRPRRYFGVPA